MEGEIWTIRECAPEVITLPRERAYALLIGGLGWLTLLGLALRSTVDEPWALLALASYATLAEMWPARLRAGTVSVLTAFLIPAVAITGTVGTAAVLAVGGFVASVAQRRPSHLALFNGGQYALSAAAAGLLTQGVWHLTLTGGMHPLNLVAYYLVFLVANHLLVDAYFLFAGFDLATAVLDGLGLDLLQSVVTLPLGLAAVVGYRSFGWLGILGIATPLVLLGYALNLQTRLRQRNNNLEVLYAFHQKFAKAQGAPEILQQLRDSLRTTFANPLAFAGLCEVHGAVQTLPGSDFTPEGPSLVSILSGAQEMLLESPEQASRLLPNARSAAVFPVRTSRGCCGLVAYAWRYELKFDREDRHLLRAAVQLASIACEKEQLLRETQRLAATDPRLPGLYNYRYLITRLEEELERNRREGSQAALIYMDLDGFKDINDRLGHLAGDEALREFANLLGDETREGDVAARYAGDEFVLVLPGSGAQRAESLAQRLREETNRHLFLSAIAAPRGVHLTFSYGVAMDRGGLHAARDLIEAADRAMYLDKERRGEGRTAASGRQPPT